MSQTLIYSFASREATVSDQPGIIILMIVMTMMMMMMMLVMMMMTIMISSPPCKRLWTWRGEPRGRRRCWRPGNVSPQSAEIVIKSIIVNYDDGDDNDGVDKDENYKIWKLVRQHAAIEKPRKKLWVTLQQFSSVLMMMMVILMMMVLVTMMMVLMMMVMTMMSMMMVPNIKISIVILSWLLAPKAFRGL